ncbi:MAG: hypothetical protein QOI40_2307 [Alphaproteobacteria bacterium]|jgi:hypothetical protein|nr:hypothetical protein [Alphaproteobacteria bacterium]
MSYSENRYPPRIKSGTGFFRNMGMALRMFYSENRYPLFRNMR